MSLVIVISENALNSMRDPGVFPSELVGREIYVHDTRDIYWESGEIINPGMVVSEEDRLDQGYYTAMALLAAESAPPSTSAATEPAAQPQRICWR